MEYLQYQVFSFYLLYIYLCIYSFIIFYQLEEVKIVVLQAP